MESHRCNCIDSQPPAVKSPPFFPEAFGINTTFLARSSIAPPSLLEGSRVRLWPNLDRATRNTDRGTRPAERANLVFFSRLVGKARRAASSLCSLVGLCFAFFSLSNQEEKRLTRAASLPFERIAQPRMTRHIQLRQKGGQKRRSRVPIPRREKKQEEGA